MIKIFDKNKPRYNIGDLLNMPSFFANWNNNPHANESAYYIYNLTADYYKGSILNIYKTTRENEDLSESIPNIDRLRLSVDTFKINNNINNTDINKNSLYIHLRSGDKGVVEPLFIRYIKYLSSKYQKIVILLGIHSDERKEKIVNSKKNLEISLNNIKNSDIEFTIDYNTPDNHLCIMRNCNNLLIHKGGFSILGSLLFKGENLYITSFCEPFKTKKNKDKILKYIDNYEILEL
jgi:hypothetical protein